MFHVRTVLTALVAGSLLPMSAEAQPLGTFRWQLLPYCNVVTLNISQQGGIYTLDGTDDRCGAAQSASARGLAFLNPNGTIGFGMTMVQPGGVPVHLEATVAAGSFNGTWRDSSGASGNFVLTVGAGIGGPLRSVPTSGVPPGSITAIQLASGAVGTPAIAPNAINGAHVLDGSLTVADMRDAPRAVGFSVDEVIEIGSLDHVILQVTYTSPAKGLVILNASGSFVMLTSGRDAAFCSVGTGQVAMPLEGGYTGVAEPNAPNPNTLDHVPFATTRVVNVAAASPTPFRLVCRATGGNVAVKAPLMTALFVASP